MTKLKKLWRYNKTTGFWVYERDVSDHTVKDWLRVYQSDMPNETFKVSINKPTSPPIKRNPTNRTKSKAGEFTSESQRTRVSATGGRTKAASRRLVARRKKTATAPKGMYANPRGQRGLRGKTESVLLVAPNPTGSPYVLKKRKEQKFPPYRVEEKSSESNPWFMRAAFNSEAAAVDYAKALHKAAPSWHFRVVKQ